MSSNSIRISSDLFEQALEQGERLSRSAAQQVEHWARLGVAVEASGLGVPALVALLQGKVPEASTGKAAPRPVSEAQLWAHKRALQQRDLDQMAGGRSPPEAMSWFSGGRARRAKALKSPL